MKHLLFVLLAISTQAFAAGSSVETCDSIFHSIFDASQEMLTVTSEGAGFHGHIARTTADGKHYEFEFTGGSLQEPVVDGKFDEKIRSILEYNLDLFSRRGKKEIAIKDVHSYRVYTFHSESDGGTMSFSVVRDVNGNVMHGEYVYQGSPGIYGLCKVN